MITSSDAVSTRRRREGVRVHDPVFDMAPFALPSVFWNPSHTRGSLWLEHLSFCFWAVEASRPASVVVTGASDGVPYFALCEAVQRLRLETQCVAILEGEPPSSELMARNEENFGEFSRIDVADGVDATTLAPAGIDLLVLADHEPEKDERLGEQWEVWLSKLSDRGVVLVPRIESDGPAAAGPWERIRNEYPHFTFHHGGGLGIIGVGNALPELLHHLLNLEDRRHAGLVRAMFARLGAAVAESHRHAAAKRRWQRAETRAGKFEVELRAASASQEAVRHELEKTAERLTNAQADLEASGQRHDAVGQELEEAVKQLKAAEADRHSAEQRHDAAMHELQQQADATKESLENELLVSSRKLELQTEHAKRVAAAVEALKQDHETNKMRLFEARRVAARAEAEVKRIADQMQAELKHAEQRIRGIKGEAAGFRKKLKHERELHLHAQNELGRILNSRSWALTAPLRKIVSWTKRSS